MAIINGPAAASRAAVATLNGALSAVYAQGSYEVASADASVAERLRQADALVPPTPTFTPFPTNTPLPTPTPLPTNTPLPTPTLSTEPAYDAYAWPSPRRLNSRLRRPLHPRLHPRRPATSTRAFHSWASASRMPRSPPASPTGG